MASKPKEKVLLAMSGGVDSSVAALLLQAQGFDVVGCFMRLGSSDTLEGPEFPQSCDPKIKPGHQGCCSVNDAGDARLVAAMLSIPFYVLNFRRDFGRVMDYFVEEYNAGRTPNPCVRCNDWLKFGKLRDYANAIGASYVATGHYARVEHDGEESRLLRAADDHKDQSYVLFGTSREALRHMLLPIGSYTKPQIRDMAEAAGLPVFSKPDSQEICFVPDNDYAGFIQRHAPESMQPGNVVDTQGQVVGEHAGQQHFTVGQRRGLGIAAKLPLYVIQKDAQSNTVTVGPREALASGGLEADQTNWLIDPPTQPLRCAAQIRSNGQPAPATVQVTGESSLRIEFDQPQDAISPGQAVVCYQQDQLIGGGWITRAV